MKREQYHCTSAGQGPCEKLFHGQVSFDLSCAHVDQTYVLGPPYLRLGASVKWIERLQAELRAAC